MTTAPELTIRVTLNQLAEFSADGYLNRAFAHAIAAGKSVLVMVPLEIVDGDLTTVIDRCPVPWPEAMAILDEEGRDRRAVPEEYSRLFGAPFRRLAPTNWDVDEVEIAPGARAARLTHPSGIRVAAAVPQLLKSIEEVFRV